MTWQIALLLYFVVGTMAAIQRRYYAQQMRVSADIVYFIAQAYFILPLGIIYAVIVGHFAPISPKFLVFSAVAAVLYGLSNAPALKSQKEVDATQFSIISNIYTPITILTSAFLLKESLTTIQVVGMMLLVFGAITISIKRVRPQTFLFDSHSLMAIWSGVALGFGLVAERAAVRIGTVSLYFVVGWAMQAVVQMILALPYRRELVIAFSRRELKHIGIMGILRFGQLATFILASALAKNVSLISSVTTFKIVFVFAASFFVLKERDHIARKAMGCILATIGLLIS